MAKTFKFKKENFASALSTILILLIAFVFISILLLVVGANPFAVYKSLIKGSFGSARGFLNTLSKSVPICCAAFAVGIGKKAGVFNIGIEGQLIFGAIGSAVAGIYFKGLPAAVHMPLCLIFGMLFGVLYALLPSVMYVKKNINLLVIHILMNSLAALLCTFTVISLINDKTSMATASLPIQKSAWMPNLITSPGKLNASILILLGIGIIMYIVLYKTTSGYELTCCGLNREAGKYSGISSDKYILIALLVGGALAGLAGAFEVQGTYHRLYDGFSPGYGYDGIPIALLSNGNPIGMFIGSILFAAIRAGSNTMQMEHGISSEIISVIQGTLVILIACEYIIKFLAKKILSGKKVKNT